MNEIEETIASLNKKYLPEIRRILHKYSYLFTKLREATPEEDMKNGFDAVFSFDSVKIPVRIRDFSYFDKYTDFTVRSRSRNDGETEITKLLNGFGDFYFYAWQDQDKIKSYIIIDLATFRSKYETIVKNHKEHINSDGTMFYSYNLLDLIRSGAVRIYEFVV